MVKKVFFLVLLPLMTACLDEPDCVREASNVVKIGFRDISDGDRVTISLNKVTLSGTDSVFYASTEANGVFIPLNILNENSSIVFETTERVDVLNFKYNTITRLISPDCGAETFITNLDIAEHTFDSVRVVNTVLSPDVPVNYEIYF